MLSFESEALIEQRLVASASQVAEWTVARVLHELHRHPVVGFGLLENTNVQLRGRSANFSDGLVDRSYHAAIWLVDQSGIDDYPARRISLVGRRLRTA